MIADEHIIESLLTDTISVKSATLQPNQNGDERHLQTTADTILPSSSSRTSSARAYLPRRSKQAYLESTVDFVGYRESLGAAIAKDRATSSDEDFDSMGFAGIDEFEEILKNARYNASNPEKMNSYKKQVVALYLNGSDELRGYIKERTKDGDKVRDAWDILDSQRAKASFANYANNKESTSTPSADSVAQILPSVKQALQRPHLQISKPAEPTASIVNSHHSETSSDDHQQQMLLFEQACDMFTNHNERECICCDSSTCSKVGFPSTAAPTPAIPPTSYSTNLSIPVDHNCVTFTKNPNSKQSEASSEDALRFQSQDPKEVLEYLNPAVVASSSKGAFDNQMVDDCEETGVTTRTLAPTEVWADGKAPEFIANNIKSLAEMESYYSFEMPKPNAVQLRKYLGIDGKKPVYLGKAGSGEKASKEVPGYFRSRVADTISEAKFIERGASTNRSRASKKKKAADGEVVNDNQESSAVKPRGLHKAKPTEITKTRKRNNFTTINPQRPGKATPAKGVKGAAYHKDADGKTSLETIEEESNEEPDEIIPRRRKRLYIDEGEEDYVPKTQSKVTKRRKVAEPEQKSANAAPKSNIEALRRKNELTPQDAMALLARIKEYPAESKGQSNTPSLVEQEKHGHTTKASEPGQKIPKRPLANYEDDESANDKRAEKRQKVSLSEEFSIGAVKTSGFNSVNSSPRPKIAGAPISSSVSNPPVLHKRDHMVEKENRSLAKIIEGKSISGGKKQPNHTKRVYNGEAEGNAKPYTPIKRRKLYHPTQTPPINSNDVLSSRKQTEKTAFTNTPKHGRLASSSLFDATHAPNTNSRPVPNSFDQNAASASSAPLPRLGASVGPAVEASGSTKVTPSAGNKNAISRSNAKIQKTGILQNIAPADPVAKGIPNQPVDVRGTAKCDTASSAGKAISVSQTPSSSKFSSLSSMNVSAISNDVARPSTPPKDKGSPPPGIFSQLISRYLPEERPSVPKDTPSTSKPPTSRPGTSTLTPKTVIPAIQVVPPTPTPNIPLPTGSEMQLKPSRPDVEKKKASMKNTDEVALPSGFKAWRKSDPAV